METLVLWLSLLVAGGGFENPTPEILPHEYDYDYHDYIRLYEIPKVHKNCNPHRYGEFYCDVMEHTRRPYLKALRQTCAQTCFFHNPSRGSSRTDIRKDVSGTSECVSKSNCRSSGRAFGSLSRSA